jgi:predicted TPR repeat methyltransferase
VDVPENPYEAVAELYDGFVEDDYISLAKDPRHYPLSREVPLILKRHGIDKGAQTVLDLGCGPGLLKEYTSYPEYDGVDVSPAMLRYAYSKGYQAVYETDILTFLQSCPSNSYDAVFCLSVTYFLSPEDLKDCLFHLDRITNHFWLLTLDHIPSGLIAMYAKQGIRLYNHAGLFIPGASERVVVPGWKSASGEGKVPMEFVLSLKNKKDAA